MAITVAACLIAVTQFDDAMRAMATVPALWLMFGFAAAASLFAFVDSPAPGRPGLIISPTIAFTFAILLCWGLGPAIVTQLVAVGLVSWRVRRSLLNSLMVAAQYTLSLAAAAVVLAIAEPDPFERTGPTNLVVDAIGVVGAMLAWLVVLRLLARILDGLRRDVPRDDLAVGTKTLFTGSLLLLSPLLAVAAHINVWFVPMVLVPLFAVQRMARLSNDRDLAARSDPLTGLANRAGLRASFEGTHTKGRHTDGARPTLLLLDLDRFKDVNDALGHDVGDQLLIAVADRLESVRPGDATAARLGGDEFALLAQTGSRQEAVQFADQVREALIEPVSLEGLRIDISASVGIARLNGDADSFADLLRSADLAMYDAKRRGDAVAEFADRAASGPERLGLLTDIREALTNGDRDQIAVHYQPQVSLRTGEVEGVEALLRWRHPVHGPIDTQELLGVVEHSTVMQLLTMRVIDDVVAQLADWRRQGISLRAALNISARDLYSDEVVHHLAGELARHRVDAGQLQVEITESALLVDPSRAQITVARIAALGVEVSLDDFGTGFSSLQHLRKLPIAEIKIDRSFVAGMATSRDDAAIVRSTVDMARSLGIRTVAEGVETEFIRAMLEESGCALAQGWLFARPMSGHELTGWLVDRGERQASAVAAQASVLATIGAGTPRALDSAVGTAPLGQRRWDSAVGTARLGQRG